MRIKKKKQKREKEETEKEKKTKGKIRKKINNYEKHFIIIIFNFFERIRF